MKLRLPIRILLPLVCAAVAAFSALFFMDQHIQSRLAEAVAEPPAVAQAKVVVANQALSQGDVLQPHLLSVRQLPQAGLAADVIMASNAASAFGRTLTTQVLPGYPLQQLHLAEAHTISSLAEQLQAGQRPLTLQVSPQQTHGGRIQLGDRVDLYGLHTEPAMLLVSGAEVLALGEANQGTDDYRSLTFQVPAPQRVQLEQLQRMQQLAFWLRPQLEAEAPGPVLRRPVEIIVGGQQSMQLTHVEERALWP